MRKTETGLRRGRQSFVDCIGTYCLDVSNYWADERSLDHLLLFLASCELDFVPPSIEAKKGLDNGNPWKYQPLRLFSREENRLFNGKSLVEFADFMSKYLSITFAQCHFENGEDVVENIQSLADWKSSFVILLIDEYYYPRREQFYGKLNNNHGLLVKEIVEGRGLLVIDSEEPDPYEVEWSVITPAVHPRCFRIESECFRSSIDIEEVSENFLNSLTPPRVYRQFGDSLSHHLELRDADHAFYLQGAVFCIAFQILPTVRMKKILVKELGRLRGMGESASVYGALEKVDTGWQELSICIMRMLVQRNCDPGVVALKLEEMAQREDILYTKMSGI